MEELIFFVIFIVLSLVRTLTGRQQPARPGPPARPRQELPDLLETVLRPPAVKVHGRREVSLRKPPVPSPDVMEPVVEASFVRPAPKDITTEDEGEAFFQLDHNTILRGLVFSEILNEPRARHRRFRRSPR